MAIYTLKVLNNLKQHGLCFPHIGTFFMRFPNLLILMSSIAKAFFTDMQVGRPKS